MEEFFCFHSNPSNDNIISAQRPGVKTVVNFRDLVEKRVWKITFFGLKLGQELENWVALTPTKNSQEYPHPPGILV